MFTMSNNLEMVATEIKAGKNFKVLVSNEGVRRKIFWINYRPDGSVYTAPYITDPIHGILRSTDIINGKHLDFKNIDWKGKQGDVVHPYISFHGSGRIQSPRPIGEQGRTQSREHLGFRLRDIREPRILCYHIMPGPDAYAVQTEDLKGFESCFNNIEKINRVPMFAVTAIPFFPPSDIASIFPRDGNVAVGFITKRLSSGIKIMVRISL